MKEFPDYFCPIQTQKLNEVKRARLKCYLRRDIFEHVINHKEEDYFSLDDFNSRRCNDISLTRELVNEIIVELKEKGWNCILSFGGTGLFIFAKEKPKNCWESEQIN